MFQKINNYSLWQTLFQFVPYCKNSILQKINMIRDILDLKIQKRTLKFVETAEIFFYKNYYEN